jgi:hypothetical protein
MEARSRINAQNDALPLPCAPATINGRPTNGPNTATRWITQIGADGNMTSHHDSQTTPDGPFASRPRRFSEGIERMPRAVVVSRGSLQRRTRALAAERLGEAHRQLRRRARAEAVRPLGSPRRQLQRWVPAGRQTPRDDAGRRLAAKHRRGPARGVAFVASQEPSVCLNVGSLWPRRDRIGPAAWPASHQPSKPRPRGSARLRVQAARRLWADERSRLGGRRLARPRRRSAARSLKRDVPSDVRPCQSGSSARALEESR